MTNIDAAVAFYEKAFSVSATWIEDPDGSSWEVFVVKADAQVMKLDVPAVNGDAPPAKAGSACCAPLELSKKPAAESAPCCPPAMKDAG